MRVVLINDESIGKKKEWRKLSYVSSSGVCGTVIVSEKAYQDAGISKDRMVSQDSFETMFASAKVTNLDFNPQGRLENIE